MNRVRTVEDADLKTTTYDYAPTGELKTVTDAKVPAAATTFTYNEVGLLASAANPLGETRRFWYDLNRNLGLARDAENQDLTFNYDAANQLRAKTLPGGGMVQLDYDLLGHLALAQDADSKVTFFYDAVGRLATATTNPDANPLVVQPTTTLTSTYDLAGNRVTMTDPRTRVLTYVPDVLNRLEALQVPGIGTVDPAYDVVARRQTLSFPNATQTTYTYTDAGELATLVTRQGLAAPVVSQTFTYDLAGNRQDVTDLLGFHDFGYDAVNRLTSATHPAPDFPEGYTYDAVGNRNPATWSYDAANRLQNDGTFTYTYDKNGNLTTKTEIAIPTNITTYTYDPLNQLTRIDFPGGTFAAYAYDALGRRIQKDVNGVITRYVYDQENLLLEYDGANVLQARYTHGPGLDEPWLLERDLDHSGTFDANEVFEYHADALGSIVSMTDSTGTPVRTYRYDTFGNLLAETGTLAQPYGFTGRERDQESGLYYYRARYYDPRVGRFLQEDPIGFAGGDVNLYSYVWNNPLTWGDPWGLSSVPTPQPPFTWDPVPVQPVPPIGDTLPPTPVDSGGDAGQLVGPTILTTPVNPVGVSIQCDIEGLSDRIKDIARKTGLSEKEVREKIHKAKKNLPASGAKKNPNVGVDTKTGEIYPKVPGGGYGDSIGNIFD